MFVERKKTETRIGKGLRTVKVKVNTLVTVTVKTADGVVWIIGGVRVSVYRVYLYHTEVTPC